MNPYQKIYQITQKIPKHKVATYGQIAALSGNPRAARMVGWALHQMKEEDLRKTPWHRVINREGRISTTCLEHPAEQQAQFLKDEGISVEYRDGNWFVDLNKYLWRPNAGLV